MSYVILYTESIAVWIESQKYTGVRGRTVVGLTTAYAVSAYHRWPRICFVCCSHSAVIIFPFMIYHQSNTTYANVERELLTLPEHLRSPQFLVGFLMLNI
jgi:predicted MFS family arabinose efflux permease